MYTPTAGGGGAVVAARDVRMLPRERLEPVGCLGAGIVEDGRDTVAGAVREAEVRRADMVVQRSVPGELVQNHPVVAGDPHRIGGIAGIGEHERRSGDPGSAA